jgi:hypothetical protein
VTDSLYRSSGRRKGTHLRGAELTERIAERERAWLKRLDYIRGSYHCPELSCAAPLASVIFEKGTRETHLPRQNQFGHDLMATVPADFVVQTCAQGHVQRQLLP